MRCTCRQTEKLIGELNQSVDEPTKGEVSDWNLAGTKAKLTASQYEKRAVSQQQRKPHRLDG